MPPDITKPDDPFFDEDEETTNPDAPRASSICPRCGGGVLPNGARCGLCDGDGRINKETYEQWRKKRK
jgi:hypothetical protein